jgi:membrane protein implicated in regulation of membrane protease activity
MMHAIAAFYGAHPFWVWMGAAALLLAAEVGLGSAYLLWPALAAGLIALLGLMIPMSLVAQLAIFVGFTVASSLMARRLLPSPAKDRRKGAEPS